MPAAVDGMGVSSGSQAQPDDYGFGEIGYDHLGAPGGGAFLPSQAGFDIDKSTLSHHSTDSIL